MKNKVKELRKQNNLRQEDLARLLGVSRQTVIAIENGKYNPSLELAFAISHIFQRSIEQIFIYEERNENESK